MIVITGDWDDLKWYGEVRLIDETGKVTILDPKFSLRVRPHSHDGFAWGYAGSGPAQLALGILLAAGVSKPKAVSLYQDFKRAFIQQLPRGPFRLEIDLDDWVREKHQSRNSVTKIGSN